MAASLQTKARLADLGMAYLEPENFDIEKLLGRPLVEHDPVSGEPLKLRRAAYIWMDMYRMVRTEFDRRGLSHTDVRLNHGMFRSLNEQLLSQVYRGRYTHGPIVDADRQIEAARKLLQSRPENAEKLARSARSYLRQVVEASVPEDAPPYDFSVSEPLPPEVVAKSITHWAAARKGLFARIRDVQPVDLAEANS